ncbi:heterokaryon incompatibility protein-domain-containing protein [Halenospora varia]|nr:heterokaryon incompatibility protein-domain-containing protein [Halenospora varia]
MRLLDVHSYKVKEFTGRDRPPYAILSHTWDKEEVTLRDIENDRADKLLGFRKIVGCCKQANEDGFDYVWIDTCCIDKASSAELSEAINSMFAWYGDAEICYAYLSDVHASSSDFNKQLRELAHSNWFNRGWTLQELIAPTVVVFFAHNWSVIGSRSSLIVTITQTTGIHRDLFGGASLEVSQTPDHNRLSQYSVAQKMSWASKRKTTRVEDEAYCLLGIFGVNLPLLYGEGKRAFVRLQEEIMKRSSDHSIFTWNHGYEGISGFLADSPKGCRGCRDIVEVIHCPDLPPHGVTNKGIQITLPVLDPATEFTLDDDDDDDFQPGAIRIVVSTPKPHLAVLNCAKSHSRDSLLGLALELHGERQGGDIDSQNQPFLRYGPLRSVRAREVDAKAETKTMFLLPNPEMVGLGVELWKKSTEWPLILVRQRQPPDQHCRFKFTDTWPGGLEWITHESGMLSSRTGRTGKLVRGADASRSIFLLFEEENQTSPSAFCLIIESDYSRLFTNLQDHVPESERMLWVYRNRDSLHDQTGLKNVRLEYW